MKNKQNRSKEIKRLQRDNWELCKEIVDLRDWHLCQIPDCLETEGLQLDHVISRQCKTTFYETDILGWLCAAHHTHKSFRKGQWVDLMVRDICVKRLGPERWDSLLFHSRKTCAEFNKLHFQQQKNIELKETRADLLANQR